MTNEQPVDRAGAVEVRPVRRHRPWLGIGISVVAAILGLIVLAWAVLFITKGRFLKPTFEKYASRYSERQVRVGGDFQLYFAPLNLKFVAEKLSVSNPDWATKPNLWSSRYLDVRLRTLPLIFGGHKRIRWINLQDAAVDAEWDKQHQRNNWTFGDPNAKGEPFEMPQIERAIIAGTGVRYVDPSMKLLVEARFHTIEARDTRFSNAIRFDGGGRARGTPFTLAGALLSPNESLAGGRTRFELHAGAVNTRVDVAGTLPGLTVIEGADLDVAARGRNLADVFTLAGIAVPDTRSYRLSSHLTKQGGEYRFTRLRGFYGNSDIAGRMTIGFPNDRLLLTADLDSRRVDIVDIGPFIGYDPHALATTGATAAAGAQTGGTPRILPDATLRIDAIKAFDAKVKYRVRDVKQPFVPVSNIALGLDLDHSLLKLSPLTMDVADSGHLASDISIDARVPAVVTQYDIRLSPTPLGKLFKSSGVFNAGTTGTIKARIQMKGTGDTLRKSLATSNGRIALMLPAGTFWTQYVQLAEFDVGLFVQKLLQDKLKTPIELNCGLIAFTVRGGVAAADPILLDTDKNVMFAKGGFSFKDESLNMTFRADGKKFSLFSGQSPVGINGYFAAPAVRIVSPQLVARGAAGVALGVLAPPAAVLAFVDPGDAKSAQCGPVLAGANAAAQRTVKGDRRKDVGEVSENRAQGRVDDKKKKRFLGIF